MNRIDLNRLHIFAMLMRERSVTRAADKLSLGQPAVSHALARLRELIGDPLFVRDGRRMEPTDRARQLIAEISPALETIEGALRSSRRFDPARAENIFSVGLTDDLEIALLPAVNRRLRVEAPHVRLRVRPVSYREAGHLLAAAEVSTVMTVLAALPAQTKVRKIRSCAFRVLRADAGRKPIDLDAYCRRDHALVSFAGDFRGDIDGALEKLGRSRLVALAVPQFGTLPALLRGTDLIATVPDYVADALAARSGLRSEKLPFKSPTFDLGMAWRAAADRDPAEAWFRQSLVTALRERVSALRRQ